jgi:hypothetical protein
MTQWAQDEQTRSDKYEDSKIAEEEKEIVKFKQKVLEFQVELQNLKDVKDEYKRETDNGAIASRFPFISSSKTNDQLIAQFEDMIETCNRAITLADDECVYQLKRITVEFDHTGALKV